jgi:hypothetical protein
VPAEQRVLPQVQVQEAERVRVRVRVRVEPQQRAAAEQRVPPLEPAPSDEHRRP